MKAVRVIRIVSARPGRSRRVVTPNVASARQRPTSQVCVAGVDLAADVAGALWWEAERLLIVSDLHLEKGSSFARRGVLLPPYDTPATLARLAAVIARHDPRTVIALGDTLRAALDPRRR